MAVISTGNHPAALWPGVHAWFGASYEKHPAEYSQIFDVRKSKMAYEEIIRTTSFGYAPEKSQGGATSFTSHSQGDTTRFTNVAYSLGAIVTYEEMQDNLYKSRGMDRAAMLAFSMRTTKETVHANILNRAFNSSYTGGDGVELCSTAHPTAAGNVSNELATPADISEASLEDLLIQIMQAKNYEGLPIRIMGDCLIVHPSDAFEAHRIVKSTLQNDTSNNAVNAVRSMGLLPKGIVVNHYLTDSDAWFIKTNVDNGLVSFEREGIRFTRDNDFDTDNAKMKAYERYVPGWADYLGLYGSAGA